MLLDKRYCGSQVACGFPTGATLHHSLHRGLHGLRNIDESQRTKQYQDDNAFVIGCWGIVLLPHCLPTPLGLPATARMALAEGSAL